MNPFDPESAARRFLPEEPLRSPFERGDRIRYMSMKGTPYWFLATVLSSKPERIGKKIHWKLRVSKTLALDKKSRVISTKTHDVFKARTRENNGKL